MRYSWSCTNLEQEPWHLLEQCLHGLTVACWIMDHDHPCSNLRVGISEGCFITFGTHSAHLACQVHKSGRITPIIMTSLGTSVDGVRSNFLSYRKYNGNQEQYLHTLFLTVDYLKQGRPTCKDFFLISNETPIQLYIVSQRAKYYCVFIREWLQIIDT